MKTLSLKLPSPRSSPLCSPVRRSSPKPRGLPRGESIVLEVLRSGAIEIGFALQEEALSVQEYRTRYANVPMDLADACLVRMAELHPGSSVLTLDSDFSIYRTRDRRVIPRIAPPET